MALPVKSEAFKFAQSQSYHDFDSRQAFYSGLRKYFSRFDQWPSADLYQTIWNASQDETN